MKKILLPVLCFALSASWAAAQVRVVKSADSKITIDLSGIKTAGDPDSQTFLKTLEKDLRLSGWFDPPSVGAATHSLSFRRMAPWDQATIKLTIV